MTTGCKAVVNQELSDELRSHHSDWGQLGVDPNTVIDICDLRSKTSEISINAFACDVKYFRFAVRSIKFMECEGGPFDLRSKVPNSWSARYFRFAVRST